MEQVNDTLNKYPRTDQYVQLNSKESCEIKILQAFRYWFLTVSRSSSATNKFCIIALHQIVTIIDNINIVIEEFSDGIIKVTNNTSSEVRVSLFNLGSPVDIKITKIIN